MGSNAVTVLTIHGRRQIVKVEQSTTFLQILEQVCEKHNFNAAEYDLKHHKNILDLTIMLRYSGLPNNAFLEMVPAKKVRIESDVTLAIQLEDGSRLEGTFTPSTSLLSIMQTLCEDKANAQSNPSLVYMRREVFWESMENTTLRSLGLTGGRAAFRLSQRTAEQARTQAHVSAALPQKEKQEEVNTLSDTEMEFKTSAEVGNKDQLEIDISTTSRPSSPSASKKSKKGIERSEPTPSTSVPRSDVLKQEPFENPEQIVESTPESIIHTLGAREAIVYHLESTEPNNLLDVPDSFYEVTVADIRRMQDELTNKTKEYETMMTSEQRQVIESNREKENAIRFNNAVIRVRFSDRYVLQGIFERNEKIDDVITFVRGYLKDPSLNFHLYTTPPKVILSPDSGLVEAKCIPLALLHFSCDGVTDDSTFLQADVYNKLSNARGALEVAARCRGLMKEGSTSGGTATGASNKKVPQVARNQTATSSEKVPKWFSRQ